MYGRFSDTNYSDMLTLTATIFRISIFVLLQVTGILYTIVLVQYIWLRPDKKKLQLFVGANFYKWNFQKRKHFKFALNIRFLKHILNFLYKIFENLKLKMPNLTARTHKSTKMKAFQKWSCWVHVKINHSIYGCKSRKTSHPMY